MYKLTYILILMTGVLNAQTALYNSGNLRIHEAGQLGFHTDLINDGSFDENQGLAGFYGETGLTLSGAFPPVLFDVEIANDAGVDLAVPLLVANNVNFIAGDVRSPRLDTALYMEFLRDAFYVGESDLAKINGYASVTEQQAFTFPVGDEAQLRPLILNSEGLNPVARCAYFRENAANASAFPPFNTEIRPRTIGAISAREFWRLEGSVQSTITLSWNEQSDLPAIAGEVSQITLMGWNKASNSWAILGNNAVGGDLQTGFVSSEPFVPDAYEVITFGSLAEPEDILTLSNYLLTPNGDGNNDVLIIPELEQSPNNLLQIFDRNGLKVFEKANYTNEFDGISNAGNFILKREIGLPEGVYFYLVSLYDLQLNYQGFLYLYR